MKQSVTASDIAKVVGVSQQVVSAVIRGVKGKASAETRQRILDTAKKLHYTPNGIASMLSSGKGRFIALLFPPLRDHFYAEMLQHLCQLILKKGYFPLYSSWSSNEEFDSIVKNLAYCGLAGVITTHDNPEQFPRNVPIVCNGQDYPEYDGLMVDDTQSQRELFERLWSLGHRHFGFLGGYPGMIRYQTHCALLKEHGLRKTDALLVTRPFLDRRGMQAAIDKLLTGKQMPTAIFCANDVFAMRACAELLSRGIRIPEDMSVVGCDNIAETQNMWPTVTTMDLNVKRHAQELADLMFRRIEHPELSRMHRIIVAQPVWRESCGTVPDKELKVIYDENKRKVMKMA